jgi:hypothetical protein
MNIQLTDEANFRQTRWEPLFSAMAKIVKKAKFPDSVGYLVVTDNTISVLEDFNPEIFKNEQGHLQDALMATFADGEIYSLSRLRAVDGRYACRVYDPIKLPDGSSMFVRSDRKLGEDKIALKTARLS